MPLLMSASPALESIRRAVTVQGLSEVIARRGGPTELPNGWRESCSNNMVTVVGGTWSYLNGLGWVNFDFSAPTNLIPTMTSNSAPSGVAVGGTDAWQAFDASATTLWANGGTAGETGRLGYQWATGTSFNLYSVIAPAASNKAPSEWGLETWTGSSWFGGRYGAANVTRQFAWKPGEERFFPAYCLVNSGFSLNITAGNGANALGIAGMRAFNLVNSNIGYGELRFQAPREVAAPSGASMMRVTMVIQGLNNPPFIGNEFSVQMSKNGTIWSSPFSEVNLGTLVEDATSGSGGRMRVFEATALVSGTGGSPKWIIKSQGAGPVVLRAYQVELI